MPCENSAMDVLLASPRGFCAGVDRAIEIVELALARTARRSTCATRSSTTSHVVDDLRAKGAVFIDDPADVPAGALADLQRARRVAGDPRRRPSARGLRTIDATCPLVTKVHVETHAHAERRLRRGAGRPRGPRRGRGHDGPRARTGST